MSKRLILVLLVFLGFIPHVYSEYKLSSLQYEARVQEGEETRRTIISKNFFKGDKFRMETETDGRTMLMIYDGQNNYFYDSLTKTAVPALWSGSEILSSEGTGAIPRNYKELPNLEFVSQEVLEGKECDLYTYSDTKRNTITKLWIDKELDFPIKKEVVGSNGKLYMRIWIYNIRKDMPLDDSLFELPPDAKLMGNKGVPNK